MAKRKRRSRGRYGRKRKGRRSDKRFPVLLALPIIKPTITLAEGIMSGAGWKPTTQRALLEATGVDYASGTIHYDQLASQASLAVIGLVGHKMANKLGMNRMIKRIPVLGSYIKL
jgi:hypothetical protein